MLKRLSILVAPLILAGQLVGCTSPLQKAAYQGDVQAVRTLLDQGAGANKEEVDDLFVKAAAWGNLEMVKLLLERGASFHAQSVCWILSGERPVPYTALECASAVGKPDMLRFLLDHGAPITDTALMLAVDFSTTERERVPWDEIVELLLKRGANANAKGLCYTNISPMELARVPGYTALECAMEHNVQLVQPLLAHGAKVSDRALERAISSQRTEPVTLLLDHGANVDGALLLAATNTWADPRIVQLLLDRGANIHAKKDGRTPLEIARAQDSTTKIVRLLEQAEAKQFPPPSPVATPAPASSAPQAAVGIPTSDVDHLPSVRGKPRANAYAIIIGVETYRNKLPRADYAVHDAEVMSDYLIKVMGYQEENVAVLLNDRAAKADFEKYFEKWLPNRVERDASVFIYFSGHGAPNPKTGDAFLVPYDGDPAFVDETGYSLKRLYQQVGKLPAKDVVVMLDSCFSGAGGRSVIGKGMRPMVLSVENPILAGNKTVVLAASAGDQVSSTHDKKNHGLLTYFFLKGLQGEADGNKDGAVELKELFAYLKPQVERTARREYNNEQTPQLLGNPDILSKGVRLIERSN